MKQLGIVLLWSMLAAAAELPWYMKETAMTGDGRLTFLDKPWWPKAKSLPEGGSFTLDLNHDGRPDTLIQKRDGNVIEIIDDSGKSQDLCIESVQRCLRRQLQQHRAGRSHGGLHRQRW